MSGGNDYKKMRLNRFLARAGMGSRREVENFILGGRVTINGKAVMELATTVDPENDVVTLDGETISLPKPLYYKCYKPRGVVTTMDDPQNRKSLADILKQYKIPDGVVPAGRLDLDSEGLLILTSDGDLLQRLTHPRYEITKTYRALVDRWPTESDLENLRMGVQCKDFEARALAITRMGPQPPDEEHPSAGYWLEIVMGEGKKREIREMLAVLRYRILRLVRIAHGPINLGTLLPGKIRELEKWELDKLPM